ncbi:hypothetical protein C6A87_004570 [Mycobacterium sp. ITM-2016-00317]|uniref:RNase H family protein n=1 Tax=Mycobacterium sp. ITM-2016-00317 TaxID=2099694 RepID=UPI00287F44A7|nr:RNase H family protein [Mycobacterium sp. ITM-2016-00317]WNG88520.1 hypothetical protein C6A87_004570 [Mycobacterium sp. ITM-2016-00317]
MATDGSVRGRTTGFAWLASSGEFGLHGSRHSRRASGSDVVLVTELRAIDAAVREFRGREITVFSDNMGAVSIVKRWMDGEDVLPKGYSTYRASGNMPGLVRARQMIYDHRETITPVWAKGHQGEPLNEGAHALARLASRYKLNRSTLDNAEYRRRAEELAASFSREFRRQQAMGYSPIGGQPPHTTFGIGS